jgi:hypothetical protein
MLPPTIKTGTSRVFIAPPRVVLKDQQSTAAQKRHAGNRLPEFSGQDAQVNHEMAPNLQVFVSVLETM